MWQSSCRKWEGKKKKKELWQPRCQKLGEKFNTNLGNEVAENEGEKRFRPEIKGEKNLCRLICGNGIAEMRGKKNSSS